MRSPFRAFGEKKAAMEFGRILTDHKFGAAVAGSGAGVIREQAGTYLPAFVAAGAKGVIAAGVLIAAKANAGFKDQSSRRPRDGSSRGNAAGLASTDAGT